MTDEKKNPFIQKVIIISILLSFLITSGGLLLSWSNERGKRLLLEDQVRRNTELLKEYNPELINHRFDKIDTDLDKIDAKIENILTLVR